jgi:molecular chaperone HtpG
MAEERTFQIQLEGLIQLLAQNLYADPDVFLREMIQNAHDSITRRAELAAERGEPDPPSPRIQVVADPDAQQIRIHDNGSGLTRDEIDVLAPAGPAPASCGVDRHCDGPALPR